LGDAWIDGSFQETGDLCITSFGPNLGGSAGGAWNEVIGGDHYYLQEEWSNEDGSCQPRDEADSLSVSARARVWAHQRLHFSARASDPDGSITFYSWFFGDGRAGHGRRLSHSFRRPGTYTVVLRTTDRSANWAFYTRTIRVSKEPRVR
jgi:hypothetical protein